MYDELKKKLYIEIKKYNLTQQNNLRVCVYLLCGLYATPRSAAAATNYSFTEIDELDVWEHKIKKKKYFCAYNKRGLSPFYWVLLLLYKNDIQHKHICVSVCVCVLLYFNQSSSHAIALRKSNTYTQQIQQTLKSFQFVIFYY